MRKQSENKDFNIPVPNFLTDTGKAIFHRIKKHCEANNILFEIDDLELGMLANSFDLYARSARFCSDYGVSMTFDRKDGKAKQDEEDDDLELDEDEKNAVKAAKGGIYQQVRPEYTVMKNEYQNILKHSSKFGLNPGDRAKIFAGMKKEKKKGFNLKIA